MNLKIAVPSKGRISNPSIDILERAGLGLKDNNNRQLISKTHNKNIDIMFARASDIPEFVSDGIVDMGITGIDLINESESEVIELLDLDFGQTKLVLASPEDSGINSIEDVTSEMTVATEFPTLTKKYLEKNNLNPKIVKLSGSTEIAPFIGVADLITDLTSTGTTLKMNHLKIIDTILESTIVLITNENSLNEKKTLVEAVNRSIKGVIDAFGKKLIMMNVKSQDLDEVRKLMPSMEGPTVSEVLSKEKTVAIQAVIDEDQVFELVNDLRNAGAKDILVVPIERII
ncbi:MAG: ATP phosphoribosyltransferase [Methanobrevibacter sp.]|uniref:ATP phosphoribosyltransferase n=1 Tax=Methanobrevibacter sp. TaxID=66852 RepID=UPI001B04952A|nr:ATP phosphoribosyltransferase [Methanobrevibacter sp.]MBO5150961.1 ATP phosphoribosyltransferase [Methanobrevibacter sp.]MBO6110507.1 ATP phosphoribosyltransferase [Methanobrevibacter sp.]